eukprot:403331488
MANSLATLVINSYEDLSGQWYTMTTRPLFSFMSSENLTNMRLINAMIFTIWELFDIQNNLYSHENQYWYLQNTGFFNGFGGTLFLALSSYQNESSTIILRFLTEWYQAAFCMQTMSFFYIIYNKFTKDPIQYARQKLTALTNPETYRQIVTNPRVLLDRINVIDSLVYAWVAESRQK